METLTPVSNDILDHYTKLCESVPLYPLHNEQDHDKAILILNYLLDAGGANESHPLARLVDALGVFIGEYETHHEFLQ
jgi:HTH-type transcriptional regulator / antitoxin HigA